MAWKKKSRLCVVRLSVLCSRKKRNKNVRTSVLLKPSYSQPKLWSWSCWETWWPRHLYFSILRIQDIILISDVIGTLLLLYFFFLFFIIIFNYFYDMVHFLLLLLWVTYAIFVWMFIWFWFCEELGF